MARTHLRRASSDGSSGPSTTLTVAIVCSILGAFVLILFVLRALVRARVFRRRRAPLPPVQDLAHHRAAHRAADSERKRRESTWLAPGPPAHGLPSPDGSAVSLVRAADPSSPGAWPPSSAVTPSSSGWEVQSGFFGSDAVAHASSTGHDELLPLPPRPFVDRDARYSSTSSDSSRASSPAVSPYSASGHVPRSSTSTTSPGRSTPRTASHSYSQPRSPATSLSRATGAGRGPRTSRHSLVQVVLPAPLAPQLWAQQASEGSPPGGVVGQLRQRSYSSGSVLSSDRPPSLAVDSWIGHSPSSSRERRESSAGARRRSRTRSTAGRSSTLGPIGHQRTASSPSPGLHSIASPAPPMPTAPLSADEPTVEDDNESTLRGRAARPPMPPIPDDASAVSGRSGRSNRKLQKRQSASRSQSRPRAP